MNQIIKASLAEQRQILGGASNEVSNILNTNDEIELENDTFSLASISELKQDLAVKTPIIHDNLKNAIIHDNLKISL